MVVDPAKNSGPVSVELMSFNGEAVVDRRGEREREGCSGRLHCSINSGFSFPFFLTLY